MRKNKIVLYFFTAVLLVTSLFVWTIIADEKKENLFSVQLSKDECIEYWQNEEKEYYVFLPSYADLSEAKLKLNTSAEVSVDDKILKDGMRCNSFELNKAYDLSYTSWGKENFGTITFLKSKKVATMYIDTASGDMEYIHSNKENEEAGKIRLYKDDGSLDFGGELESIKGRGNYTWTAHDKKPYSLKLTGEANLLGMGNAQKWVLLANAGDLSNIRNKLVYDVADKFGLSYSPESSFVDLYLNGEYVGLYQLCEKNEVAAERVDIGEDGFLVSLEMQDRLTDQNLNYVETSSGQALRVHYPQTVTQESSVKTSQILQSVENAIAAEDGTDKTTGKHWTELIDLDSWARKYLIEEFFGSCDAGFISQFFYCDMSNGDGKVYAGPVWDFDHSIGNSYVPELYDPQSFFANRLSVKSSYTSPWFYNLYNKDEFYDKVIELYQNEFIPLFHNSLSVLTDEYATTISDSAAMNQIRWNHTISSDDEIENMIIYLGERKGFLDRAWLKNENYHIIKEIRSNEGFYTYHAVFEGEKFDKLPELENTEDKAFLGWYYADSDEPFDSSKPIYEDTEVYAKWQDLSNKKLNQIIKLIPLGIIAVLFICLCIVEFKKLRKTSKVRK